MLAKKFRAMGSFNISPNNSTALQTLHTKKSMAIQKTMTEDKAREDSQDTKFSKYSMGIMNAFR